MQEHQDIDPAAGRKQHGEYNRQERIEKEDYA
jgi:hypothetical protein